MADVTAAFLAGKAHAQAEAEHEQQIADNKLRTQVLKHQLNSIKLEDQMRAADLAKTRADMGLGQEGDETTPSPIPPSMRSGLTAPSSIADGVMQRALEGFGMSKPTTSTPAPAMGTAPATGRGATAPSFTPQGRVVGPADGATDTPALVLHSQDTLPTSHAELHPSATISNYGNDGHAEMKKAGHVWLPGLDVPELGIKVPGMWYSARAAAEEQSRRAIALKRAEMPLHNVGPEDTAVDAAGTPVYTNPNSRGNAPAEKYIEALKKGDTAGAKVILQGIKDTQRPGGAGSLESMLLAARQKGDTASANLIAGVIRETANARRDPNAAADRDAARTFTENMRLYTEDVANGWKKHADAMKLYLNDPLNTVPETAKPAPEYAPPSYESWVAEHGTARDAGKTGGKAPAKATGKTISEAELAKIAKNKGTTLDVQRARYKAGGYTVGK